MGFTPHNLLVWFRQILHPTSNLVTVKIEAVCSSLTSEQTMCTTRCQNPKRRPSINNNLRNELRRYLHAYCVMWNQHLQRRRQAISVSAPRNEKLRVAIILGCAHTATNAKVTAVLFICRVCSPSCKDTYHCFGEIRCLLSETSIFIHRVAPRHVSVDT